MKQKKPNSSVALARVIEPESAAPRSSAAVSGLESAFLAFLQSKIPGAIVPIERRIFLTLTEAAEFSGLPAAFLRGLIASGRLKALKTGAGWRIPREQVETLSKTLTQIPEQLDEHELSDIERNRRRRQGLSLPSDNI